VARDRDEQIIALVRSRGTASVGTLSRELGIGASSVRRNLYRLASEGRLVRTYGGATMGDASTGSMPVQPIRALGEKQRIAMAAARLVADGQTIAISSGSTALEFARQLVGRRGLTVITNSIDVVRVLLDLDGIQLVVLGGVVRPGMHSLLGHLTEQACGEVRADALFMGIGAVSLEHGLMNDYLPEILTDRALRSTASSVVVLADAGKFELMAPGRVFELEEVDIIVTDSGVRPEVVADLTARGIQVIVA
jgi:DeoR family transcriptional regulator, aga operon transcriptional repressor